MEKIEEILMQDELFRQHFVAKHPPKYEFSGEINPAFLGRDSSLDFYLDWIKEYSGFPLIEDDFSMNEHALRRKWRRELIEKYGKEAEKFLKTNNKLRGNILSGVYSVGSIVVDYLGNEFPEIGKRAGKVVELTDPNVAEDLSEKNISERIELVRKIEDHVYDLLTTMSK